MRCYHFGNYYMSSIQQGIQAAHCQMELFVKYKEIDLYDYSITSGRNAPTHLQDSAKKADMLFDWAKNHKTTICLSAGNNGQLNAIKELFEHKDNKFPWSYFKEDEESLGGILTNVCIVLPEEIYETASKIRYGEYFLDGNTVKSRPIQPMNANTILNVHIEPRIIMTLTDFELILIQTLNSYQLAK